MIKLPTNTLLLTVAVATIFPVAAFAASWESVAPISTARNQFAAGVIDNNIYIFGGNPVTGGNLKSTEMLNVTNPSAWSNVAENEESNNGNGVEEVTGAGLNGKFYVFGAYGNENPDAFVHEYDPSTNIWSSKAPVKTRRYSAIAASYSNEIYVFGGEYFHPVTKKGIYYKVVEAYSPASNSWRKVTNMPVLRQLPAVSVVGDKAYVMGGGSKSTFKIYNNLYAYDFKTNKWKTSGLTPLPTPRVFSYGHSAPVLNGKIYLVGGAATAGKKPNLIPSTKVEIYDPLSNTWQIGPPLPQPALFGANVAANNAIYVISGELEDNETSNVNNVWKLTDAWKSTLTKQEACDLNADGKFSSADAALFTAACKNNTAYWPCDLNNDSKINAKDTTAYNLQWKNAKKSCPINP